jgi:hypothetical protein
MQKESNLMVSDVTLTDVSLPRLKIVKSARDLFAPYIPQLEAFFGAKPGDVELLVNEKYCGEWDVEPAPRFYVAVKRKYGPFRIAFIWSLILFVDSRGKCVEVIVFDKRFKTVGVMSILGNWANQLVVRHGVSVHIEFHIRD